MQNNILSLIGCGWLGKPLAERLHQKTHQILATTAHDKSEIFQKDGIPYIIFDMSISKAVPTEIIDSEVLIYMIPPLPLDKIKSFFDQISTDKKIIFISSTAIYGKNLGSVDEQTILSLQTTSSPLLFETEVYLKNRFPRITILRLGGLYGIKRHPIYFLQGKKDIPGAHEFLHLVHLEDSISAIIKILEKQIWGETFNIISDLRIKKIDYYTFMAKKLNVLTPLYTEYVASLKETIISNEKSKIKLGIKYLDPNEFYTSSE